MAMLDLSAGVPQPQGPGEDPMQYYTKLFVRFLQLVFGSFEKGAYQWNIDPELSDIQITDQSKTGRDTFEKRPAITVARGIMTAANLSLDQLRGLDPVTGVRTHTDLYGGSVIYNCISSVGLEAQRIAWIAEYATRCLKRSLMKAGIHRVGEDISMGSESAPGSIIKGDQGEAVLIQVNVPFYFQQTWHVQPIDKLLLKNLNVSIHSNNSQYPATGANPLVRDPRTGAVLLYDKLITLDSGLKIATAPSPKHRK